MPPIAQAIHHGLQVVCFFIVQLHFSVLTIYAQFQIFNTICF